MKGLEPLRISCEFFPPKTPEGVQHLSKAAAHLQSLQPSFFSVTFGAGGSTRAGTLDAVKMLQDQTTIPAGLKFLLGND